MELLDEHTAALSDVLAVERELARVRETIERLDAQQQTLEGRIAMARVEVSLLPPSIAYWEQPVDTIVAAAVAGMQTADALAVGLASVVVAFGPTLLFLAPIGGFFLLMRRRRLRAPV